MPLTHNRYEQVFEYMFILCKGKLNTFNPKKKIMKYAGKVIDGNRRHDGENLQELHGKGKKKKSSGIDVNVWEYSTGWNHTYTDEYVKGHPGVFPEALARDHILSWSNEGDMVFDPMMGSGTTGKMAVKYGRNFTGIEISEEYCSIAERRIKDAQLQIRMKI